MRNSVCGHVPMEKSRGGGGGGGGGDEEDSGTMKTSV